LKIKPTLITLAFLFAFSCIGEDIIDYFIEPVPTLSLSIPIGENKGDTDGSLQTGDGEFIQYVQVM